MFFDEKYFICLKAKTNVNETLDLCNGCVWVENLVTILKWCDFACEKPMQLDSHDFYFVYVYLCVNIYVFVYFSIAKNLNTNTQKIKIILLKIMKRIVL